MKTRRRPRCKGILILRKRYSLIRALVLLASILLFSILFRYWDAIKDCFSQAW